MNIKHVIDDFLMYLSIEKNYSQNTVNGYAHDLKTFEAFLVSHDRSLELDEISKATIRRYIHEQIATFNIKPATVHRRISCLKSFAKYCLNENLIQQDFTNGIESPKTNKKLPVYMTLQELQILFRYLDGDHSAPPCESLFL